MLNTFRMVIAEMGLKDHDCHHELPRDKDFQGLGWGGGAIALQEAYLLLGLVMVARPDYLIELGTSRGASAAVLGAILKDAGHGTLISVDMAETPPKLAADVVTRFQLPVTFACGKKSLEYLHEGFAVKGRQYMVFSDTDIPVRPFEVQYVIDNFPKGTVIVVHDTSDLHPSGPMKLASKVALPMVELPSPRGITVMRT